ncbi:hypothetical protein J7E79_14330 [Bacillus sp. ISL-40]|uniref:hypothetical protein n=1 Tax=unclassified Bacillus (in: firmicutes) TaxID=185979 RepID=UPI001BEB30D9|nr:MULTISPECIES: hypothetical protein [unclassified Bacillus (in: firmicutes)]MBT2698587.1 hypothetical protein [Bacillus sp. ISL-40]MBT2720220.1 hypothetical protein [Bacillus sp. ISL-46]MBT2739187.1 hypothetical protein [Bacillus sp. ISL-77]
MFEKVIEKFDEDKFYLFNSLLESNQFAHSDNITHYYEFISWATKPSRSFLDEDVQFSFLYFICEFEKVLDFIDNNFFYNNDVADGIVFLAPHFKSDKYDKYRELREHLYKLCEDLKYYYENFSNQAKKRIFLR